MVPFEREAIAGYDRSPCHQIRNDMIEHSGCRTREDALACLFSRKTIRQWLQAVMFAHGIEQPFREIREHRRRNQ